MRSCCPRRPSASRPGMRRVDTAWGISRQARISQLPAGTSREAEVPAASLTSPRISSPPPANRSSCSYASRAARSCPAASDVGDRGSRGAPTRIRSSSASKLGSRTAGAAPRRRHTGSGAPVGRRGSAKASPLTASVRPSSRARKIRRKRDGRVARGGGQAAARISAAASAERAPAHAGPSTGRVFHRRCSQNHCSGTRRIAASIASLKARVNATGSPSARGRHARVELDHVSARPPPDG